VSAGVSLTDSGLLAAKEMSTGPESSHTQLLPNNPPACVCVCVCPQCLGPRGGSGGGSEDAAAVVPRPGEVSQLADGGRDHLQRFNRRHQQRENAGAAGGRQEPAGPVEGRTHGHLLHIEKERYHVTGPAGHPEPICVPAPCVAYLKDE